MDDCFPYDARVTAKAGKLNSSGGVKASGSARYTSDSGPGYECYATAKAYAVVEECSYFPQVFAVDTDSGWEATAYQNQAMATFSGGRAAGQALIWVGGTNPQTTYHTLFEALKTYADCSGEPE